MQGVPRCTHKHEHIEGGTVKHWSHDPTPHGVPACPSLGAQRRFDLHRTDLIDHSCGPHLA